jgi:hypothetical protein
MIPLPTIDVLDSIAIPIACPVPWDEMHGNDRTRFCDKCSQNVHDVSELTKEEAVQLVTGDEKPCLRLYRRQDGRVMTSDCATKRERVWKWLDKRSAWVATLFALVFMGCMKPAEKITGDICPPGPPKIDTQGIATDQRNEQARRSDRAEFYITDHTTSASRMDDTAKAEAPTRQETATER